MIHVSVRLFSSDPFLILFQVVCPECERVICFECIYQHQLLVNDNVEKHWIQCQNIWNEIISKSSLFIEFLFFIRLFQLDFFFWGKIVLFDEYLFSLDRQVQIVKSSIERRAKVFIESILKYRQVYRRIIVDYFTAMERIENEIKEKFQAIL